MYRSDEDPIWDLVICIAAAVGTVVWLAWMALAFRFSLLFPWPNRLIAVVAAIMALMMLAASLGSWWQWKRRHQH